ncbi:uncharacterized protein LOC131935966 [Physella acuta]|uniref:uncharacterized protein LOC131935966 n=1 Tax=Physella acuta TaxID=109671 RepID=UPI0027DC732E|nr:uncharacterized protein LOC131935966 [Physella acuta]
MADAYPVHGAAEPGTHLTGPGRSFPIAVGPCKFYRWSADVAPASCGRFCSCGIHRQKGRKWRDIYLRLHSDSSLRLYESSKENANLITVVFLDDLYKDISFGDDLTNVKGLSRVPDPSNRAWDGVLAVPDEPNCNSEINWLDFGARDTLNKWLVAICSSIPAKKLRGWRKSRVLLDQHKIMQDRTAGDALGIQAHIDIFFPRDQIVKIHHMDNLVPKSSKGKKDSVTRHSSAPNMV